MKIKQNTRTKSTIFNFVSSVGGQIVTVIINLIVRTVFIHTLGKSYLGIDGLFANILQMLSLAEFGVGSAIIFKLYDPIAKDDTQRIAILMKFYKTMYRYIGFTVLALGICLIPFLPYLIKDYDGLVALNINVIFLFALYLLQAFSSYLFFAYKSAIISAHQKEYIITLVGYIFTIISGALKILVLVLIHKFEVYVGIVIFTIIGQNFVCAKIADKMYPYINNKTIESVSKDEFVNTIKDCGALFLYKLNTVVLKATDNIVLAFFLGLDIVALYSNYYIFYTTLNTLIARVFNSVAHSLGNLHTTHDWKHEYRIYEVVMFICAILGGTVGVGIAVVSDELVFNWIGNEWVIAAPFSILMGIEAFSLPYKSAFSKYRSTMGLFQQAKFRPVAGMIINLIVSIGLVQVWGIAGVLVGTIVADWTTLIWYDPIIIHKYGFENNVRVFNYFKKYACNFITVVIVGIMDLMLCKHLFVNWGWLSVLLHAGICAITVPVALLIVNVKGQEVHYIIFVIKKVFNRIKGVKQNG